jgi:hypothetical protein
VPEFQKLPKLSVPSFGNLGNFGNLDIRQDLTMRFIRAITVVALTTGATITSSPEPLLLLDRTHLDRVRTRINAKDRDLTVAMATLRDEADKALEQKPLSVMDKLVTPPSGDKHDYMSQAPYWWPDPSKPGGRPYIRRDGDRNPEINRITDHANFDRVIRAVATLGLAFHISGRQEYATHTALLVRVWFLDPATQMNPHLKFGQGIPGINNGRGIGIIETRALPELIDGILLIKGASPAWTASDEEGLQSWMRSYLTWLLESSHGKEESKNGNNHETFYDVQVASLALYTGQRGVALRTLEGSRARIARQIQPDGRQPRELERTRSWDYSIFNLRAFFQLAMLGERVGVDLWNYRTADGRSLRGAVDYLFPFAAGDRRWTDAQITPFRPSELHWLLRQAAIAWREPRYQALATRVGGRSPRMDLTLPSYAAVEQQ